MTIGREGWGPRRIGTTEWGRSARYTGECRIGKLFRSPVPVELTGTILG